MNNHPTFDFIIMSTGVAVLVLGWYLVALATLPIVLIRKLLKRGGA